MRSSTSSPALAHDLEPPERFPFLPGLDGLRAVAIIAVLLYGAEFTWAQGGFLGVDVFFVISGYLITSLLLVEWLRTDTIDLKAFWSRRARRLLPAVFLLFGVVAIGSVLFLRDTLYRLGGDILAASTYILNWFFIFRQESYFESFGRPALLKHLWSLSVEEQFYVLWPILFSVGLVVIGGRTRQTAIRRFRLLVAAGAVGSTVLMALLYTPFEDPSRVFYGTDTRASGLLIGVALALWWMPWRLPTVVSARYRAGLRFAGFGALFLLVAILSGLNEFSPWLYRGGFTVTSLLTATVIAVIAHPAGGFGTLFTNRTMKWIGVRSYGIYLWYWPVYMITRPGLDVGTGQTTTFLIRIALTLGIAGLSFRFVEEPIRRIGYRRWMRNLTTRLGIVTRRGAAAAAIASFTTIVIVTGAIAIGAAAHPPSGIIASPSDGGETIIKAPTEDPAGNRTPSASTESAQTAQAEGQHDEAEPISDSPATRPIVAGVLEPTPPTAADEPAEVPSSAAADAAAVVTLIGDSVLKGAEVAVVSALGPDTVLEATVSRQFKQTADVVDDLRVQGKLSDVVVIHLGTNGPFSSGAFDQTMEALGDIDRVFVVNAFVPRRWESVVNAAITSGKERWPRIEVIDYNAFGNTNPDYFNEDGVHLNAEGMIAYAELLDNAING